MEVPPRTEQPTIKHHLAHTHAHQPLLWRVTFLCCRGLSPAQRRVLAWACRKVGQTMQTCRDIKKSNHSEALTLLQLRSELSPSLGLSIFMFDISKGPTLERLSLSPKRKTGNSTSWTSTAKQTYLKPLFHCFSQGITKALFISVFRCTCK